MKNEIYSYLEDFLIVLSVLQCYRIVSIAGLQALKKREVVRGIEKVE